METPYDPDAGPGQRGYMSKYKSPHGKPEGLADRLQEHARRLGTDKTLPWLGLGLHADLLAAAAVLRGQPIPTPAVEDEFANFQAPTQEFDL